MRVSMQPVLGPPPLRSLALMLPPPSQRLATGEWFTSRVSATGLFATAYPRALPSLKAELRQLYSQLCRDETPMVRRAAAQKLGAFAAVVEGDLVSRELMPLFTDLMQDGEARVVRHTEHACMQAVYAWRCMHVRDAVHAPCCPCRPRLGATAGRGELQRILQGAQKGGRRRAAAARHPQVFTGVHQSRGKRGVRGHGFGTVCVLMPCSHVTSQDKSWRVRYNVATQLVDICEAMSPEVTRAELAPAFIRLLRDPEAEVRVAAAGKVGAVSKLLAPAQLVPSILPCVTELSMDSSQFVRTALAGVVMELAPLLGKQATIGEAPGGRHSGGVDGGEGGLFASFF
jgi:serine/threonine-protein phosphatase 2A regulatory subunit A